MVDDRACLDPVSLAFHEMEKDRDAYTTLCVARIDGVVPRAKIERRVKEMVCRFPTFSSVIETREGLLAPRRVWVPVDVDYSAHIFVEKCDQFKESRVQARINEIYATPFVKGIPRWTFHYLSFPNSDLSFLVAKLSHTYGDGPMLSHIFASLSDQPARRTPALPQRQYSLFYRLYTTLVLLWLVLASIFRRRQAPELRINAKAAATRPVVYALIRSWPRSVLRATAVAHGATVHSLLQALLFRAVRLYDGRRRSLRSLSVFSLRRKARLTCLDATNNLGGMYTAIDATVRATPDVLEQVQQFTECYKASLIFPFLWIGAVKLAGCVGSQPLTKASAWCGDQADFGFSSYKVPLEGLKIGGHKVSQIFAAVKPYRLCTVFSATSYDGTVNLTAAYREGSLADLDRFRECLAIAYKELEKG